jgi:hypothetical protein
MRDAELRTTIPDPLHHEPAASECARSAEDAKPLRPARSRLLILAVSDAGARFILLPEKSPSPAAALLTGR